MMVRLLSVRSEMPHANSIRCPSPSRKRGSRACPWLEQGAAGAAWSPGFPLSRRAVRGKSRIGEIELVVSIRARSRWGGIDGGQGSTFEQPGSHQISEPQGEQARSGIVRGDAQQQIGDHYSKELQANGIL